MIREIFQQYMSTLPAGYQEALIGGATGAVLATLGIL